MLQNYLLKVNDQGLISSIQIKSLKKEIDFQQGFAHYTSNHLLSKIDPQSINRHS